jgi:hypothetical protein
LRGKEERLEKYQIFILDRRGQRDRQGRFVISNKGIVNREEALRET